MVLYCNTEFILRPRSFASAVVCVCGRLRLRSFASRSGSGSRSRSRSRSLSKGFDYSGLTGINLVFWKGEVVAYKMWSYGGSTVLMIWPESPTPPSQIEYPRDF